VVISEDRRDGKPLLKYRFDSMRDLYLSADLALKNEKNGIRAKSSASAGSYKEKYTHDSSFCGCLYEEAVERRYSHKEGLEKIREMAGLEAIMHASQYVKHWSDYDGDTFDIERYQNEQPFLCQRRKVIGSKNRGMFRVIVSIAEPWMVDYDNMLWKTYAACRICDELESQGHRVEILAVSYSRDQHYRYEYTLTEIHIKRFEESMNLAMLCTSLSPWTFRVWMFMVWSHYRKSYSDLGSPCLVEGYYNLGGQKTAIIIDKGDCLSEESANNFIRTLDIGSEVDL